MPDLIPRVELAHSSGSRARVRVPGLIGDARGCRALRATLHEQGTEVIRIAPACGSVVLRTIEDPVELVRTGLRGRRDGSLLDESESRDAMGRPRALTGALAGAGLLRLLTGATLPAPLLGLLVAAAARPVARRAWTSLRIERRLSIDVLDLVAITLTTLRGSFLTPVVMIGSVEIGEAIRARTERTSRRRLGEMIAALSPEIWIEQDGARVQVPLERVRVGDVVVVYPGDRIPVDGRVLEGEATVDEHQLTGEPEPVLRAEGESVYASTLVREGHLHIAVEQIGHETRAGRMLQLMQDAPVHDTRIESLAARTADRLVLPAFLLSGMTLAATRDTNRAAAVLIADLTTGIRVAVPTTILAGMARAARHGVLVRSGRALEGLAELDVIVFDKTGTVTAGQPEVRDVIVLDDQTATEHVLRLAATADQRLTHPVAESVVQYALAHGVRPGGRGSWTYRIGLGVEAEIDGSTVLVGSDRLIEQHGLDPRVGTEDPGTSRIYVAADGRVLGALVYSDPLRPESIGITRGLRQSGIELHLLTGDREETAVAVGEKLGIGRPDVHARLFPEDKAAFVRGLRKQGLKVAFVGDGVNDLPALAYADVAISLGSASDAARETADVVLVGNGLSGLPEAITIARHAMRISRQNIVGVSTVNLATTALAATGGLSPALAAVVHNGSSVLAALNGLRPLFHHEEKTDG